MLRKCCKKIPRFLDRGYKIKSEKLRGRQE
jgi:hypothetical protein